MYEIVFSSSTGGRNLYEILFFSSGKKAFSDKILASVRAFVKDLFEKIKIKAFKKLKGLYFFQYGKFIPLCSIQRKAGCFLFLYRNYKVQNAR